MYRDYGGAKRVENDQESGVYIRERIRDEIALIASLFRSTVGRAKCVQCWMRW